MPFQRPCDIAYELRQNPYRAVSLLESALQPECLEAFESALLPRPLTEAEETAAALARIKAEADTYGIAEVQVVVGPLIVAVCPKKL